MSIPIQDVIVKLPFSSGSHRFDPLLKHFSATFDQAIPQFVVAVPGRVNLIGEHVDYSGFAVLPMAIEKRIWMIVGMRPIAGSDHPNQICANGHSKLKFGSVRLSNLQHNLYQPTNCNNPFVEHSAANAPAWHQYFTCGYRGVMEKLQQLFNNNLDPLRNKIEQTELLVSVSGDIPPSSGLSSSSALVCAAAIAVRHAINSLVRLDQGDLTLNQDRKSILTSEIDRLQMASDCATFERFIGTQGGGMDQAIALLAEQGTARLIEFYPQLSSQTINLPENSEFFVAHCGETLNKAATDHYNRRVLETRSAAVLLRQTLADQLAHHGSADQCVTLGQVMRHFKQSLQQMIEKVHETLERDRVYSVNELLQCLNVESIGELANLLRLPEQRVQIVIESVESGSVEGFRLYERALHVFEEADRVYQVQQLSSNGLLDNEQRLQKIGSLMNDSHHSCRDLYDCSSQSLDRLVQQSLTAGALGARLTGAGWGGCIVALVPKSKCQSFLQHMNQHSRFVFQTSPAGGAIVYNLRSSQCE